MFTQNFIKQSAPVHKLSS